MRNEGLNDMFKLLSLMRTMLDTEMFDVAGVLFELNENTF
jgi:hypothetical protein